jgi:hypothetical protein
MLRITLVIVYYDLYFVYCLSNGSIECYCIFLIIKINQDFNEIILKLKMLLINLNINFKK